GLYRHRAANVVLDPVMVATAGDLLLAGDAIEVLRDGLMPRADLVTPNLAEAAALLGGPLATSEAEMVRQAEQLMARGARAVLVKGGHLAGAESVDILLDQHGRRRFATKRIASTNTHGTGCTLSAAIAAGLAKGAALPDAVA